MKSRQLTQAWSLSIQPFVFCLVALLILAFGMPSQAQVFINELAASNDKSVENNAKFPDWIELYNISGVAASLNGMSLTNLESKDLFVFPSSASIPAHDYLVIWCDSDTASPGLHTGFSLKSTGGSLALYSGPNVVDSVAFGLQLTDLTVGRVPDGTGPFQLCVPTAALPNQAVPQLGLQSTLKFNEWMATNSAGADKDWLEIYNPDPLPVELGGLIPTGKTTFPPTGEKIIPALSYIAGSGFFRFWCDSSPKSGADHLNFKLSSSNGETLSLYSLSNSVYTPIDQISFPGSTDPNGLQRDESMGRLPDGDANIVKFPPGRDTPAASNFLPLTNVVINEILTHTDPPLEDAIELRNVTGSPVDISYWWLSDNRDKPKKFQIPAGTVIPGGGFKVFYEQVGSTGGFNTSGTGNAPDFRMNSAHGGELYLFTGDAAGTVTGFRRGITYDSAAHGISFGRYVNSVGDVDITAMSALTFGHDNPANVADFRLGTGLSNSYPKIGPIVINEFMYHPPDINQTNDDSINEYIELHNIETTNVPLYFVNFTNRPGVGLVGIVSGWRLDDAVTYTFTNAPVLPANAFALVVPFDPATNASQLGAFRSKYGISVSFTNIFGPYLGKLKNSSASVKLYKPDTVQEPPHPDAGFIPYVLVDRVDYADSGFWPTNADGYGASLQRRYGDQYGNDPANWGVLTPTPGRTNLFSGPLHVDGITRSGGRVDLVFTAQQGQPYTVEFKNDLNPSVLWTNLSTISATATGPVHAGDILFSPTSARFYRVRTPASP